MTLRSNDKRVKQQRSKFICKYLKKTIDKRVIKADTSFNAANKPEHQMYKTEELIDGKLDVVMHPNIIEAKEWQASGIDVKVLRKEGEGWVESGAVKLELMP